ncbi:transcriptional regulator [Streptococcus fryi]
MLITEDTAKQVRIKRAIERTNAKTLAKKLGISHVTLAKVERGDYDAPKRIYEAVINWLLESV